MEVSAGGGEFMSTVLEDVDMVLVNTTDTQPSPPGIFVLFDEVGLMVKSLELLPSNRTEEPLIRIPLLMRTIQLIRDAWLR